MITWLTVTLRPARPAGKTGALLNNSSKCLNLRSQHGGIRIATRSLCSFMSIQVNRCLEGSTGDCTHWLRWRRRFVGDTLSTRVKDYQPSACVPKPPPMASEPMETCQDPPRDPRKQVRATLCGGPYMPQAPMDTCRAPSPKATTYLPGSGLLRSTPRRHGDEGIAGGRKALLLSLHAV